jgi:hypothetical protein
MRREILAVALAAMSTGRQVDALVDPPGEHTMQCYELGVVIGFPVIESPEQRRRHEEEQRKREEEQRKREEEQRKREEEAERRTREAEERRGRP